MYFDDLMIQALQYRLLQAWSRGGRGGVIIGDPDQAIYGFRGADCESFLRFCQEENPSMSKLLSMAVFYKTMEEMLTALAFGREADLKRCGGKCYTSDAATLMTMHGAKGLEFPTLFLCGLQEGIVPLEYKGPEILIS